ncbi:MAG TPA: mechanosensitive ion channel family protein [Bryobacteraceae bacterium]|nr:mechanosensitive ion channel family protein [Bryobacteraceae bacterium]
MKAPKNLSAVVLAILLVACLLTFYFTRDSAGPATASKSAATAQPLVDTSLLQAALNLAPLAATPDEQGQAHEAWRLADHELDLTFDAALREAQADAEAALPSGGPLRQLSDAISRLKERVEADKKRVDELGKDAGDALDLARAQLDLDQDELDDSQQDLAREGGDKRARLQRLLQEHEASEKIADQTVKYGTPGATGTMSEQLRNWLSLGECDRLLHIAAQQAAAHASALLDRHNTLERQLPTQPGASASVATLRQLSGQHKTLTGLDQRLEDAKQLVTVYQNWSALVESRRRSTLHLMLRSLAAILGILLVAVLLNRAVRHAFRGTDRHRLHQLRVIARITLQVVAVLLILLIVFGPPTQLTTLIGLVTAGLTVVMKDFIVAFFGWFTLMGKNGIRVGDWVEIEGVSGQVVEIGLLKTVLLELGNWTETGHPTGRRVAFSNSFAMEGHFFNFSTSDQWLWDELQLTLPPAGDPYQTVSQIREIVERETSADSAEATKDWQRVTHQYGAREFSAGPAVNLRPGINGLEVVVRYITRAPQRNIVKSKLSQAIVDLLRQPA